MIVLHTVIKDIANDTPKRVIHKDSDVIVGESIHPSSGTPNSCARWIRGLLFSTHFKADAIAVAIDTLLAWTSTS